MVYQYRCKGCGEYFEVKATLAEKEAGLYPTCPRCETQQAEQVFTGVGLAFDRGSNRQSFSGSGCCGPGGTC